MLYESSATLLSWGQDTYRWEEDMTSTNSLSIFFIESSIGSFLRLICY